MYGLNSSQFAAMAFLWPALVAESASELASATARGFADLAIGPQPPTREPQWTTPNRVALELPSVRLRDFSTSADGSPTLLCAPFALHQATITDFAPDHSLVAALRTAGIERIFVTDWRSASPDMRFLAIDNYLADLNVLVDELGGYVDLIGLCQGGWLALTYAALFPLKVRKLVLAGAPIDVAAGTSRLSRLAHDTPLAIFHELANLGGGRILGRHALRFWAPDPPNRETSMRCCSRRGSRPRRRFAASKLAFVTGTGARSICLAPTICRSSSNSSGKTGWPPAASWPSAGPSSCPACGSRYFCSPPETTMSSRANRCSRSESWSTDGAARSTRPSRRADISACSWARKPSPTCGGRLRTGFDRKNVFEARGRVRRRQRHNRADSQMSRSRSARRRWPTS